MEYDNICPLFKHNILSINLKQIIFVELKNVDASLRKELGQALNNFRKLAETKETI